MRLVEVMVTKTETPLVNAPMTQVKLNGKNYVYWAWFVKVFLKGKGLSNSIESHFRSSCMYLPTAYLGSSQSYVFGY